MSFSRSFLKIGKKGDVPMVTLKGQVPRFWHQFCFLLNPKVECYLNPLAKHYAFLLSF